MPRLLLPSPLVLYAICLAVLCCSFVQLWVVKMHNSELTPFNIRHAVTLSMPGDEVQGKVTE